MNDAAPPDATMGPVRTAAVAVFSVGLLVLLFVPILRDPPRDGFPLSNYPMFSHGRDKATAKIGHVVGFSRQGRHRPLSPDLLATEEVMQAHQTIRVAIRRGKAAELCAQVAQRARNEPGNEDLSHLEVRTDHYDALAYFSGDTRSRRTQVHARCNLDAKPQEAP